MYVYVCMHIMATMDAVIDLENSEDSSFGSPGIPPSTPSDETAATGSSRQRRMSRPNTLQEIRSTSRARKEKLKAGKCKVKVQEKKRRHPLQADGSWLTTIGIGGNGSTSKERRKSEADIQSLHQPCIG